MLAGYLRDFRYALRALARTPAFTVAATLTLGLGIGANTAIFSLIETVVLRTLPLAAPEQLVFLASRSGNELSTGSNSPFFERVVGGSGEALDGVTGYSSATLEVALGESTEMPAGQFVSGTYHAVLGVPMALGRGFATEAD